MLLFFREVLFVCLAAMYVDVRHICLSACVHVKSREPMEGYSWNFVQENLQIVLLS
jgi:hypothetical protein